MKKTKTNADSLFESYLSQEHKPFTLEPYAKTRNGDKNPDYLVTRARRKILVEVKEISFIGSSADQLLEGAGPSGPVVPLHGLPDVVPVHLHVAVEGEAHLGMAHHALDDLRPLASRRHDRRGGVPHVVEPKSASAVR